MKPKLAGVSKRYEHPPNFWVLSEPHNNGGSNFIYVLYLLHLYVSFPIVNLINTDVINPKGAWSGKIPQAFQRCIEILGDHKLLAIYFDSTPQL